MTVMLCVACGQPLDENRPWQPGLEPGTGLHLDCLDTIEPEEEDMDDRHI